MYFWNAYFHRAIFTLAITAIYKETSYIHTPRRKKEPYRGFKKYTFFKHLHAHRSPKAYKQRDPARISLRHIPTYTTLNLIKLISLSLPLLHTAAEKPTVPIILPPTRLALVTSIARAYTAPAENRIAAHARGRHSRAAS